jgi:hypothetical protein
MELALLVVLHNALPPRFIQKMKDSNQQPMWMPYDTLRYFTLNNEEAARNPGQCPR